MSFEDFARLFKDYRSGLSLNRKSLPDGILEICKKVEHGDFGSLNRDQIIFLINTVCLSREQKIRFINMLNQILPPKKRRNKFDSKINRRRKFNGFRRR